MIASEQVDRGVAEYRPVSGWALAALFIGLLSFVALFHPLLWSVPMAGVVVSLIALLRISHADVPLVGRKAAVVGLAFSLLYGVAAPVRVASRDYWLRARADRLANTFMDLIRSHKTAEAYALMRQSLEKKPLKPAPGSPEAKQPAPKNQRELFTSTEPVKTLLSLDPNAQLERLSTTIQSGPGPWRAVAVLYEVHRPDERSINPLQVVVYVEQVFDEDDNERWWIVSVANPPPPQLSM